MTARLAKEVAEGSRVTAARFVKPTHGNALVEAAKRVQRLQTKASKLRRELKAVQRDLSAEKRTMRALMQAISGAEGREP
jgi:F0F1-type ATP synthase membrane subunit b/b'